MGTGPNKSTDTHSTELDWTGFQKALLICRVIFIRGKSSTAACLAAAEGSTSAAWPVCCAGCWWAAPA